MFAGMAAATVPSSAQAAIVSVDLTDNVVADGDLNCADASLPCQFTVGSRTMTVSGLKDFATSTTGTISGDTVRGLGVSDAPDAVRIGRNVSNQEALQFVLTGAPVTLLEIVLFDVDFDAIGDTPVSFDLVIDGVVEQTLTGNGSNALVAFDLTGLTPLVNDFAGSAFAIVATANAETGFFVHDFSFDVVDVVDPPVDLPLPATLGLLGVGLAATGLALRRPSRDGERR